MTERNQENDNRQQQKDENAMEDEMVGKGWGMQGIDKAPGVETSQHDEKVVACTQKGKGKVDGDPSKPSDQPIKNE